MALKIIAAIFLGLALLGCESFGTLFAFWSAMSEGDEKRRFDRVAWILWAFSLWWSVLLAVLVAT